MFSLDSIIQDAENSLKNNQNVLNNDELEAVIIGGQTKTSRSIPEELLKPIKVNHQGRISLKILEESYKELADLNAIEMIPSKTLVRYRLDNQLPTKGYKIKEVKNGILYFYKSKEFKNGHGVPISRILGLYVYIKPDTTPYIMSESSTQIGANQINTGQFSQPAAQINNVSQTPDTHILNELGSKILFDDSILLKKKIDDIERDFNFRLSNIEEAIKKITTILKSRQ